MSAQHTPGPWWSDDIGPIYDVYAGPDDENGACIAFHIVNVANARLIAAAPDLLALAHQYADECGNCSGTRIVPGWDDNDKPIDEPCQACADIWRVIDKAEGRT